MRLFIGIELTPTVRASVASVSNRCRSLIDRAAPGAVLRWVDPDNLHITVWFLGEVDEERAATLREVLLEPFRTPAFRVELKGFGAFPPAGSPRVIWMGVKGHDAPVQVHQELAERLPLLGFEPERRAYSPHLTLARVRELRRVDVAAVRSILGRPVAPVERLEVPAITLFRSRLSPKGSQYEGLLRVPLR